MIEEDSKKQETTIEKTSKSEQSVAKQESGRRGPKK
jgi:hypothetical protein